MICEAFDVVVVPFPFTDRAASKRRPALVLSDRAVFNARIGHAVLAMITSAAHSDWPLDVRVTDLKAAELPTMQSAAPIPATDRITPHQRRRGLK